MIKVVSFNTLAVVCADTSLQGFPFTDTDVLDWSYRSRLIERKIVGWCVEKYIICLQEVDQIDWYGKLFSGLGYNVIMGDKLPHRCLVAHPSEMEVRNTVKGKYPNCSQEYLLVRFKDFIVVNTHLKSKKEFFSTRIDQIKYLLSKIKSNRVIVAGDFNESNVEDSCLELMFRSGYSNAHPFMESTTCKKRDRITCHKIDWIWFKGFNLLDSNTEVPCGDMVNCDLPLLPTSSHPSDHVSVTADLH